MHAAFRGCSERPLGLREGAAARKREHGSDKPCAHRTPQPQITLYPIQCFPQPFISANSSPKPSTAPKRPRSIQAPFDPHASLAPNQPSSPPRRRD